MISPEGSARQYVRLRQIASGGMGEVELVLRKEGSFRRLYAIKTLHPTYREDADIRAMFLDEARIAGLLRHPNVVSVLDVGESDVGPYLVMDYVAGVPAQQLIRKAREADAQLPPTVCIEIAAQAAEGLHAAHELRDADGAPLGLVHRDVSPQNILIGFDGAVRLTDFGIAKAFGRSTRTSTGILKGKVGYMSPEQLKFQEIDRRSDLFSLGVVLFELLTCERLYPPEGTATARRILEEAPPDLGLERDDVPPDLVELAFELLAKDPERRPATAQEVADRLRAIGQDLSLMGDDAVTLRDFMARELAADAQQHDDALREAIEKIESGEVKAVAWGVSLPPPPAAQSVPPPPKRSARAMIAVAAGAVTLAAGVWIGQQLAGGAAEPRQPEPAGEVARAEEAVEPLEPLERVEPAAAPALPEIAPPIERDPPPAATGEAEPAADEAEPERPSRDARLRRARLRRSRASARTRTDETAASGPAEAPTTTATGSVGVRPLGWDDR